MATATGPADTRMMGIVHGALQRDLLRAREAVSTPPYPQRPSAPRPRRARRVADGLPARAPHRRGRGPLAGGACAATPPPARCWTRSRTTTAGSSRPRRRCARPASGTPRPPTTTPARRWSTALDALVTVLVPHLDREVAEAMPVVSRALTHAEWDAIEQEQYVKPKSISELGFEGHWLLDDIDPEGYDVVVHTVNPVVRLVLLRGFARRVPPPHRGRLAAGRRRRRRAEPGEHRPVPRPPDVPLAAAPAASGRDAGASCWPQRPDSSASAAGRPPGCATWRARPGSRSRPSTPTSSAKADLLMAAIDVAVVGDAAPVPLDERTEFAVLGEGSRAQRARAAAHLAADVNRRTVGVNLALREAASSDDALDRLMRQREEGRRHNVAEAAALVAGHEVTDDQVDALWAVVDVGVFRMLTDLRGWSGEQYEAWLADTIDRLLGGTRGRERWGRTRQVPRSCRVEAEVAAPVSAVWAVVADVTRTGEWSHECLEVAWTDGATDGAAGARFRGSNKASLWRWQRTCEVTGVEPERSITWRTVPTWRYLDSTEWRITLEPSRRRHPDRADLRGGPVPGVVGLAVARVVPPHLDRSAALTADLERIGEVAARDSAAEGRPGRAAGSPAYLGGTSPPAPSSARGVQVRLHPLMKPRPASARSGHRRRHQGPSRRAAQGGQDRGAEEDDGDGGGDRAAGVEGAGRGEQRVDEEAVEVLGERGAGDVRERSLLPPRPGCRGRRATTRGSSAGRRRRTRPRRTSRAARSPRGR